MNARPFTLALLADGIPDVLKAERRWLLWRYEPNKDRWAKIPKQPSGYNAKPNDPVTWTSFDVALAAYATGRFDGLGFALGDGWAGIDIDGLTDGPVIERLTCYRETSPSGTGVKGIGRSSRIGGEVKVTPNASPIFTTWTSARYFAVTGHGSGDPLSDITPLIDEWFGARSVVPTVVPSYIRVGDARGTANVQPVYARLTDDELVRRILGSVQAAKFIRLVKGDMSEYGNDHSRADQGLVSLLVYWCQNDVEQIDRLFRQSALMSERWERSSYRRATLTKAVGQWV